jgi:hypothetical protein
VRPTLCKFGFTRCEKALLTTISVIGKEKPWISLPKGKGVKLSIAEERDRRRAYALAGN